MALHRPATPTAGLGQHRCRAAFHGASGHGRRRGCGQAGCFPQLRLLQPPAHALGPGRRRPGRPGSSHLGALKSTEFTTCHPAAITIVTTSRQRKAKQNLSETTAAPARRPLRKGGSASAVCSPELGGTRAPQSQVPRRSPPWAQHRARAPGQGLCDRERFCRHSGRTLLERCIASRPFPRPWPPLWPGVPPTSMPPHMPSRMPPSGPRTKFRHRMSDENGPVSFPHNSPFQQSSGVKNL